MIMPVLEWAEMTKRLMGFCGFAILNIAAQVCVLIPGHGKWPRCLHCISFAPCNCMHRHDCPGVWKMTTLLTWHDATTKIKQRESSDAD